MEPAELRLSTLNKTWVLDFDGTLVRHNGYKSGQDEFLPGSKEFMLSIPPEDFIIILTAREKEAREKTEQFLKANNIRYNLMLFEMPMGERILFNDCKPSGLVMAHVVQCQRDKGLENLTITIDPSL